MPQTFTFPLSPAPPPAAPGGITEQPSTATVEGFLGFGLIRPFVRDASDFAAAGGFELVRSAVGQILGTDASSEVAQGELPWDPNFGSKFYLLRHRKGGLLTELARTFAMESLGRWEPRVRITNIIAEHDPSLRALRVKVFFDLIDRNVPGNNVIQGGLEAEVTVPVAA